MVKKEEGREGQSGMKTRHRAMYVLPVHAHLLNRLQHSVTDYSSASDILELQFHNTSHFTLSYELIVQWHSSVLVT